jgi:hypothetical protein
MFNAKDKRFKLMKRNKKSIYKSETGEVNIDESI